MGEYSSYWIQIGNRIRHYREARGLSQQMLADQTGRTRAYIAHLESGRRQNPSLKVILQILYVLEVPLAEFFAPFTEVINPFAS